MCIHAAACNLNFRDASRRLRSISVLKRGLFYVVIFFVNIKECNVRSQLHGVKVRKKEERRNVFLYSSVMF